MKKIFFALLISFLIIYSFATELQLKDLNFNQYEFFNGSISVELPNQPKNSSDKDYTKILFDKNLGGSTGRVSLSRVSVFKFNDKGNLEDSSLLTIKKIQRIRDSDETLTRKATIILNKTYVIILKSNLRMKWYKSESHKQERIAEDDAIFKRIIDTILIKNSDGTTFKPEQIVEPLVIKDFRKKKKQKR